jgi:protein-disulfide isomerase/uncharacterized membrane protein
MSLSPTTGGFALAPDAPAPGAATAPPIAVPSPRLAFGFALLCVAGVAAAVELTRIHVLAHTDPSFHSVCALSEGVNCETVAVSPWSAVAGLPVAVWGLGGYLVMGALALWARGARRLHPAWPWGILLALAAFSAGASAVLAFISATRIDSLCLFCLATYAVNAALLALGVVAWRRSRAGLADLMRRDLRALGRRPALSAGLALGGVVALSGLELLVPPYWRAPGWADLPRLSTGADGSGHHWIGARDPKLTIVEFSDYQCPHCRASHKSVRALVARHRDRVRLVHRHLPLDLACNPGLPRPFHAHACRFAEAAECAGLQGRFWEMNDALFSIQDRVKSDAVDPVALALRLGLDRAAFKRCLEGHATAGRVASDIGEAMARRLTATPSFLVGEKVYVGRIPAPELRRLLPAPP